jgi:hypothetical protein
MLISGVVINTAPHYEGTKNSAIIMEMLCASWKCGQDSTVRYEVLMVVNTTISAFYDVTQCSLAEHVTTLLPGCPASQPKIQQSSHLRESLGCSPMFNHIWQSTWQGAEGTLKWRDHVPPKCQQHHPHPRGIMIQEQHQHQQWKRFWQILRMNGD